MRIWSLSADSTSGRRQGRRCEAGRAGTGRMGPSIRTSPAMGRAGARSGRHAGPSRCGTGAGIGLRDNSLRPRPTAPERRSVGTISGPRS